MYLVTLNGLIAAHDHPNEYVDATGTSWICSKIDGWRGAPSRETRHTRRPTSDGAHRSAAYRETRNLELAGRYFPPSGLIGKQHGRRIAALCPDPGELYPLLVEDEDVSLVSYVEQAGEILVASLTPLLWDWSIPLVSPDPYLYSETWISVGPDTGAAGSGGIDFTAPGVAMGSGIAMGTAPDPVSIIANAVGTADSLLVFEVRGPTSGVFISDGMGAIIGVRGEVYAGEAVFVNASPRVAYDVPGALVPIPAYGAANGASSARGAVSVTGGYPTLPPGTSRTYVMTGAMGAAASLTVHTRGSFL